MTVSLRYGLESVAAWRFRPLLTFKPSRPGFTVAGVLKLRVVAVASSALMLAASPLQAPVSHAAPGGIAGMIVFLDPGHNGANDANMTRQVPTGRGDTKDCQASGTATADGFPEHTFNWDTVLLIRQQLTQLGVRTAMSRGNDDRWDRASMNARPWPTPCSPTRWCRSTPMAARRPAAASTCCTPLPR